MFSPSDKLFIVSEVTTTKLVKPVLVALRPIFNWPEGRRSTFLAIFLAD